MKTLVSCLRKYVSIKNRLLLMFLVPGAIFYLFSTALSFSHMENLSKARTDELKVVIESGIGKTSAQLLNRGLRNDLEEILKSLVENTSVSFAAVHDLDDSEFASAGENHGVTENTEKHTLQLYHQSIIPVFSELEYDSEDSKRDLKLVGKLVYIIDVNGAINHYRKTPLEDTALLFITMLLCSPFFYALYRSFSKPLSTILKNILEFEKGEQIWLENQESGDDEFTQVEQALTRVARTINEQNTQIIDVNKTLEQRALELEHQVQIATRAREEADRATAQKDKFVANVSHELRHPLVGVVSGVELIEHFILAAQNRIMELSNVTNPEQFSTLKNARKDLKDAISAISISKKCSKSVTVMIDDLLASIQDMYLDITLNPLAFGLYDSLNVLLGSHALEAQTKGINYQYRIIGLSADSQIFVKGDWVRMSQIINNLIDNAVRFTDLGEISIIANVEINSETADIGIIIKDTGVGISDQEKESIFKLFHIGEDPTNKRHAGLGTGLTIAHQISQRMKGELKLTHSELGKGSVFSFDISLPLASDKDFLPSPETELPNIEKKLNLLYVEDSAVNRQVFKMWCDQHHFNVIMAENGKDGIDKFHSHRFDALIVDCCMPEMNGFQFVKYVREQERVNDSGHLPIFALTADASTRNRERCFEAGYDEFLTKPYTKSTFRFVVDRITRINKKHGRQ